ncbi:MAG: hypothetical protein ACUVWN_01735 [bacterium]
MTKCAYCGNEVDFKGKYISSCYNGCQNTLFLCKCGAANRTLANWCRLCGKEISIHSAEVLTERNLNISSSALDHPLNEISLLEFGISKVDDINEIIPFYGYMFISSMDKIFILNSLCNNILESIDFQARHVYIIPQIDKKIYIFAGNDLYSMDLVRDFHKNKILSIQSDEKIDHKPVFLDNRFFISLRNENTRLCTISYENESNEIITLEDNISQPLKVKEKIFFYTKNNIFAYNYKSNNISKIDNLYGFSINLEPKHEGSNAYVLGNGNRIYRVNMDNDDPEIFGIPHPQIVQANFDVTNNRILISHSNGVLVSNILGQIEWSSDQLLSSHPAYKFAPISFGQYIAFVMTHPNVELLYIIKRPNYNLITSCPGNFSLRPIFYAGYLYTVTYEEEDLKMRVYSL